MIAQCPKCWKKQEIPDSYSGMEVKCLDCKSVFTAIEYHKPIQTNISDPPENSDIIKWRRIFFTFMQVVAVIWFIASAFAAFDNPCWLENMKLYDYSDNIWRDIYSQQIDIHILLHECLYGIQCLLAMCAFCLASIAKK